MGMLDVGSVFLDGRRGFMAHDLDISDNQGNRLGTIRADGAAAARMVRGTRRFTVVDQRDAVLLRIRDRRSVGRDTFRLSDSQGQAIAKVVKHAVSPRRRMSIIFADDTHWEVLGTVADAVLSVVDAHEVQVATIGRERVLGVGSGSPPRFLLTFTSSLSAEQRLAVLGAAVASKRFREKDAARADSYG